MTSLMQAIMFSGQYKIDYKFSNKLLEMIKRNTMENIKITPKSERQEFSMDDIIEKISNSSSMQQNMNKLNESQIVNTELASEVMAILQEIEGNVYDQAGEYKYINWESDPIPYYILRRAGESEAARLIKNKRRLDFVIWGSLPVQNGGIERGAKLVFCNPLYQPSPEEKLLVSEWEIRLINSFFYPPNESKANFGKFIGAAYEDFFDLDDITLEVRMNGMGDPVAVHLQDPVIYKPIIKPRKYDQTAYNSDITELLNDYEKLYNEPAFIQNTEEESPDYLLVYRDKPYAAVTRDRVRKHHFFVRSDFRKAQRGFSIVEQAIRMITYITNALKMNASNFSSKLPQGFFAFMGGGVNQMQLEKLKKVLYAYQSGGTKNGFPMISFRSIGNEKADVKWVGTRESNRDMEYHHFMTLLFSIFCQLSGTDPREVSLGNYGEVVGRKSLFDGVSNGLVKESRDSGARTFLTHLADSLNENDKYGRNIFQRITGLDVKLQFVGFEVADKQKRVEIQTKELATTKSINDLLAEQDVPKQTLMLGDINIYDLKAIGNQQVFQTVITKANQQYQQSQKQANQVKTQNSGIKPF